MRVHSFETRRALAERLAARTLESLERTIDAHGEATWLVSGGSTPKLLFEVVRKQTFPWKQVTIALVDERFVALDHPRSNEAFIRTELNCGETAQARFVSMKQDGQVEDAAVQADRLYRSLPPVGPCLLGMGSDGHTASLFPRAHGLEVAFQSDAAVVPIVAVPSQVTGQEVERLTMTPRMMTKTHFPYLLITGDEKRKVLDKAVEEGVLPVARVAKLLAPLEVFWAP